MARKKAIMQSVAASKALKPIAPLGRSLVIAHQTQSDAAIEAIGKLMYSGQWDKAAYNAMLSELGCSVITLVKYEHKAKQVVRMSMKHPAKAFERLTGILNEIIDRTMEDGDLKTTVAAVGKLADITGLNKQVIEHREGDRLEDFRRRVLAGEDVADVAKEATDFLLGIESGTLYQ